MMGDTELEPSPSPLEDPQHHQHSPPTASPSISITSSPSLSLPSSPSSGPLHPNQQQSPSPSLSPSEGAPAPSPPLDIITEGVGELSLVIDPEVAKKACQEVLQKVKLLQTDGEVPGESSSSSSSSTAGTTEHVLVNGTGTSQESDVGAAKPPKIREEEDLEGSVKSARRRQRHNPSKQSWLLRLFESKLFDVSMAISYLHNSKEPGVQAYIGNRLFSFRHEEVDFYLPQLLNMYIHMDEDVGDAIKPYVVGVQKLSMNQFITITFYLIPHQCCKN